MSTFSAPSTYSITLNDPITVDSGSTVVGNDTITLTSTSGSSDYIMYTGTGTGSSYVTLGAGAGVGIIAQDITSINPSIFNWKMPEEFVDSFPDYERVQQMCEEYPGLKIAYEKFVTTYKLVKDDYDTPKDKRKVP
jgi:hypothetical protein